MAFGIQGEYILKVKFGGKFDFPISPSALDELSIIEDLNKFLPEFRIKVADAGGVLTHKVPFDSQINTLTMDLSDGIDSPNYNSYDFKIFRRFPNSEGTVSTMLDIGGLLNINNLFTPDYSRGFSKSIKDILTDIALKELGCDSVDISSSLSFTLPIVQPQWSNAIFLADLKTQLYGKNGESSFKIFITPRRGKNVFVCKSVDELIRQPVSFKFVANDVGAGEWNPILNYQIIDNYKVIGVFAGQHQGYSYFDYMKSANIKGIANAQDFNSLSDYFLIDKNDPDVSNTFNDTGCSNDFTPDFAGRIKTSYQNRLNSLVNMWIMTHGLVGIQPGMCVNIFFPHGTAQGDIYSYQYSGYYLVERVIHTFGNTHMTRLLLTRQGLATDKGTTLVRANKRKSDTSIRVGAGV